MKKTLLIVLIIVIVGIGAVWYLGDNNNDNERLIGGDTDENGCLVGAGYSWCEEKQKCLRVWEENCAIDFVKTGNIVNRPIENETENWVLIYEEPGKPALQANLYFTENSSCDFGNGKTYCLGSMASNLSEGQRVKIEGTSLENRVLVYSLSVSD